MPTLTDDTHLIFVRGDSYVRTFAFFAKDTFMDALLPMNLIPYGTEWNAQLRKSYDAEDAISFNVDSSDAASGRISVSLTALQTTQLPAKGVWDLQVIDTAQNPPFVRTMLRGTFEREKDVTRLP